MKFDFDKIIENMIQESNEQQPTTEDRIAALEQAIADLALLFNIQ